MTTALDLRMAEAMARLTGPTGPMATAPVPTRFGVTVPAIVAVPPSLGAYFALHCARHGEATFLVDGTRRMSFAETHRLARRMAHALAARHGIRKGDRVAIAARNGIGWIIAFMAIAMAGGVATLLNGWWLGDELADSIADSGATLVFADTPRRQRLATSGRHIAARILPLDPDLPVEMALAPLLADEPPTADFALPDVLAEDDATILFTSGSTGRSRAALSDHRAVLQAVHNYVAQAIMMREIGVEDGDVAAGQPATLVNLPLFHVTAAVTVFLQSFALGRKLVLMPRWDATEAMRLIAAERITYFIGVPTMSFDLLEHADRAGYDLSSCRDVSAGGAPRPPVHVGRLHREMGVRPVIGYGLTETNAVGCNNARANYLDRPGSTGRATQPLVEIAILDDEGRHLPRGTTGEIGIRSICNFKGYPNDPAATAAAFTTDGFLRTGDIGYLDEAAYLFIVDRLKDIILRGGENISCQEVEAAIHRYPGVAEAAVFGLPDERLGEVPAAAVHMRGGAIIDPAMLLGFLRTQLAAFKLPHRIWIEPARLPRTGTEKIDKRALKSRYAGIDG